MVREALLHRQRPIGVAACTIRRLRALIVEAGDDHDPARAGSTRRRLKVRDQRAGHALAAKRRIYGDVGQLGITSVAPSLKGHNLLPAAQRPSSANRPAERKLLLNVKLRIPKTHCGGPDPLQRQVRRPLRSGVTGGQPQRHRDIATDATRRRRAAQRPKRPSG